MSQAKNRSKSQHAKNNESKQLHFIREVNEEFEKMMAEAEEESLYGNMTWCGSAAKRKKMPAAAKILNIDPIIRDGITSAKAAEECL